MGEPSIPRAKQSKHPIDPQASSPSHQTRPWPDSVADEAATAMFDGSRQGLVTSDGDQPRISVDYNRHLGRDGLHRL